MHGVQRVGLVVVPSLVVPHVDGDRRVEGGEDVLGACESRKAKKKRGLVRMRGRQRRLQKWDFKGKRATIKKCEFQSKLSTFV